MGISKMRQTEVDFAAFPVGAGVSSLCAMERAAAAGARTRIDWPLERFLFSLLHTPWIPAFAGMTVFFSAISKIPSSRRKPGPSS
jgi:hypothetical protein